MSGHVSVLFMKNRIIKTDFVALLNQASLLCALLFAVIAVALPCSARWFPCYGLSAKTLIKALLKNDNISIKLIDNREEKILFPVLAVLRTLNSEKRHHRHIRRIVDSREDAKARRGWADGPAPAPASAAARPTMKFKDCGRRATSSRLRVFA